MIRIYLILIISTFALSTIKAEGIEFFKGTFEEAKTLASQEGKLIFIDAYTTWCGPCKRMSSNVFTKAEVGKLYNATFVNLKLDMEKGEGRKFQQKYRVSAFPTLLFIDPSGKVVHKVVGGMDVPNFLKLGNFAASKSDVSSKLDSEYADGQRDPVFMAQYVKALAKANRPRLKIVNEYLSSQQDLSTKENVQILFYGTQEADSRVFNLLMKNRKKAIELFGEKAMTEQIEKSGAATVNKAIEFANPDLVEEAIDKVNRYAPKQSKAFAPQARMNYYASMGDDSNYLKYAKDYAKLGTNEKFELANSILVKMKTKPDLLRWAEKWALEAASEDSSEHHHFIAAQLGYVNGNFQSAKVHANKALKIAEDTSSQTVPHIRKFMKSLNEKLGVN